MTFTFLNELYERVKSIPNVSLTDKDKSFYKSLLLNLIDDIPFTTVENIKFEINWFRHFINIDYNKKVRLQHQWFPKGP